MPKSILVVNDIPGGWTNEAIQAAVDRAAEKGGGRVEVPAGVYSLHNAVHLRTGVQLVGEAGTILRKVPSVSSLIPDYLGYGHYEVTVVEPEKFRVGMGVHVLDDRSMGFYTTVATITGISGDRLFLDRMLNHDYGPGARALAISVYPLVEAAQVTDAMVKNLTLDGNLEEEKAELNGCRGGGVFVYQSRRVTVRGVEIRQFRGDAVSFQQNVDITVEACQAHDNAGGGIHPGSGSVRYLIANNHVHDNGACGIFYCLRTTHSLCRNNLIERNGGAGISIGERDTDHVIEGNTIRGNGGPGIAFRSPVRCGGDRTRLRSNTVSGNCGKEGAAEIEIARDLQRIHLSANAIFPTTMPAVSMGPGCSEVFIEGNTIGDRKLRPDDVAGAREAAIWATPGAFPEVGPLALPVDGARHLNIDKPGPCALAL